MNTKKNILNEPIVLTHQQDYKEEIANIIRSDLTPKLLRKRLLEYHKNDIAAAIALLKKEERYKLYSILDAPMLSDILEYTENLPVYLNEMGMKKRVEILSQLEVSTAADYLQQLEKTECHNILDLLTEDVKNRIHFLCSFDEDEIGSKMTDNYISIPTDLSIRQAMKELITQAADNDNIGTIYAVDQAGVLIGAIDLKDLIIARENTPLEDILMTSYPYIYANEQIEDCLERIKGYSEDSIPVLDSENRLKGVLTAQDVTQLIDDEMGDDYAKLAGLTSEEDLHEPLRKSIGKRLPWLIILLGMGILVSSVVGLFENVVAHLALIVCFQSLVLDMAGNVGTQSLAVTIRVLMDEQLSGKQKLFLVWKESRVGLLNGLILGLLSFLLIGAYLIFFKGQPAALAFSVSFCTGAALLVSMLLSSISGTTVPLFFKKLNIDPAVASGPLITTINDLVAVVTYYGLAWILLINILQF